MRHGRIVLLVACFGVGAHAQQIWDTTGNSLLNGNYYFREVIIGPSEAVSLYGNIVFSAGAYTMNAMAFDCNSVTCTLGPYQVSGGYSIGASGFGLIANSLLGSDVIGAVGANGVFVGSATESGTFDLFIAAPVAGQSTATLQGAYSLGYLYPSGNTPFSAQLGMTANGSGGIGAVSVAAYATSATPTNQNLSGVKYTVSNNAFVVSFPTSSSALVSGKEYFYTTPDGNFVFGGSPQDFDMVVGVRTAGGTSSSAPLSGLYYEAGMDIDNTLLSLEGVSSLDTFYGAFNAANSAIVGHQRIQNGGATASGYVYHDTYSALSNSSYTDIARSRIYLVANGYRVGIGLGPYPSVSAGVPAISASQMQSLATAGAGPGAMYLNPTSAVNTASYAPFTSGISSGEMISLTGANLDPKGLFSLQTPLPPELEGVEVTVNSIPAPILIGTPSELLVQVPFATIGPIAQIQVSYKGAVSNTISTLVNLTTPGVFSSPPGGVNPAIARHANGTLVTPLNPAEVGETISAYLTGLGDVSPTIATGAPGPVATPSVPINPLTFYIDELPSTPASVELAPGLLVLYEVKIPIPTGVTPGEVFFDVAGPDSYSTQATIAVTGSSSDVTTEVPQRKPGMPRRPQSRFSPPHIGPQRHPVFPPPSAQ